MYFNLKEIIEATGAKIIKNETKESETFSFSTDTRTTKKGEIYLPLKGENFDGENFIDKAIDAGAIGYFISGQRCEDAKMRRYIGDKNTFTTNASTPPHLLSSIILEVPDTLTAYLQLANFYKNKVNPKTIVITGSSGKTTTKEMAFCVAKENFKTHKSELNFNNEIGLCKTILAMPEDTEVLILEAGMRGLGEIELISKYSEPDISIISNVGTAHIGRLGSRENIAKAKCEVVKFQKENGILITHDDELIKMQRCVEEKSALTSHASTLPRHLSSSTIYFSLNNTKIIERQIGYTKFNYKNNDYELNIEGDYNVQNSLAVIEMALVLGMNEKQIAQGLKKYSPIEKRWDVQEIGGFKIINDSYNANPDSMKAAIKTVLDTYQPPILFILGDMGELGEDEVKYHEDLGEFISNNIITRHCEEGQSPDAAIHKIGHKDINIITVGKLAAEISKKLEANDISSKNFETNLQTSCYILDNVKFGTTIVLKASRSMKFEEILEEIKNKG